MRISIRFNEHVEADLLFYKDYIVFHLIDRCIRWHAGDEAENKTEDHLLELLDVVWLKLYGPMTVYIVDGERGICSESTKAFLKAHGAMVRERAKGQHAKMIERRGALVRHGLHTSEEQLKKKGIEVEFAQLTLP